MTYTPESERETIIDNLFDATVKGKVDAVWRLQRQLERCNILLGTGDMATFENSVWALLGDLPMSVRETILARSGDYNNKVTSYKFESCCGINAGTLQNPVVQVKGHLEWEFMIDVPQDFQDRFPDRILRISPIAHTELKTDYIKLYQIIKEELEKSGASWQYEKKTGKAMKVEEDLSREIINIIVDNRVGLLQNLRKRFPHKTLGYRDLNTGWDREPATPVYEREKEEE